MIKKENLLYLIKKIHHFLRKTVDYLLLINLYNTLNVRTQIYLI